MGTSESDLVTAIKNNYFNYVEIANLVTDGLIFLCRSYKGISRKLRLFHKQLKIPCCYFNFWLLGARWSPNFTLLLVLFCTQPAPKGNVCRFKWKDDVQQQAANFVY